MSDNLYLFANNNGGQAENNGSYRLYDMKIVGVPEDVDNGVNYVDYLIGDGASYINTGKYANPQYKYEIIMDWSEKKVQHESIFGSADTEFRVIRVNSASDSFAITYNGNTDNILITNCGGKNTFTLDKNIVYQNGGQIKKFTQTDSTTSFSYPILLFQSYYISRLDVYGLFKLYSFKMWDNTDNLVLYLRPCLDTEGIPCMYDEVSKRYLHNQGTGTFGYKKTIRDFQPVLDSNNIPCLLDKINNKFYYNQGTGSFTYGGVQTQKDGYTEVEYIESNGTQYIDTGVVPNSNTDIDITCRAVSNGGYILNNLQLDTTYKYNGTDTTAQPNLTASTGATLTMGSSNIALLTEAEIAQAVLNGWTIQ